MGKILKLDDVCYRYKDAKLDEYVLKNISYEFEKGKVYAICGKSGSGKTTLLSLISGLEKCEEGKITYDNKSLNEMDLDKYRNTCIGIVFQSFNLLPHLTAIENIILSMDISNIKVENKRKRAIELLESVGLNEDKGNRRVLKLSGGEQQRVAIARSLSYNPQVILADEPTGNLDHDTENEILNIFKELAHKQNKCIIIVTHSQNVAENADEVFELCKGKGMKKEEKQEEKNNNNDDDKEAKKDKEKVKEVKKENTKDTNKTKENNNNKQQNNKKSNSKKKK